MALAAEGAIGRRVGQGHLECRALALQEVAKGAQPERERTGTHPKASGELVEESGAQPQHERASEPPEGSEEWQTERASEREGRASTG